MTFGAAGIFLHESHHLCVVVHRGLRLLWQLATSVALAAEVMVLVL